MALQLGGQFIGLLSQDTPQHGAIGGVFGKGVLTADALDGVILGKRPFIDSQRERLENRSPSAHQRFQITRIILDVSDGADPGFLQHLLSHSSHPVQGSCRQGTQECRPIPIGNQQQSIRFPPVAGHLGHELVRGDADAGGELTLGTNAGLEFASPLDR